MPQSHAMLPYNQLQISPAPDLSDQIECTTELIGRGGYGSVYKGRWLGVAANTTPVTVAIKIIELVPLRDDAKRTKRFKQITREVSLWCSIQHENILPLLGVACINGDTNVPAFVCPLMENGNAKEFCSRNPRFPPMLILYDIINGLHYLHTSQPEIVHGDIKAVNVLINNRCEACLCDFGLSRFLTDNTLWRTTATHASGTVRWMAPELLNGDSSTPTKESDIYAYAMTCYEILSGNVPFKSVSNETTLLFKVVKGVRPDRMESSHSDFMWDIITRCWEQEPDDRLQTEKVLALLQPKVNWKENEESPAKITEKDAALAKVEKEMAILNEHALMNAAKQEQLIRDLSATNEQLHEEIRQTKMAHSTSIDGKQIDTLLRQTIRNKEDGISVEKAVDLVKSLNAHIEQASILMADSLSYQKSPRTGMEPEIVWHELHDYIGSWLCNDLKAKSKELNIGPGPLITQITLQTGLVNACTRIINDWNPPFWRDGLLFSRTYSSIEKTNGRATADAWRALSRTHMTVLPSERQEANERYLRNALLKLITAVGGLLESEGNLPSSYERMVKAIVKDAIELHKIVSEDRMLIEFSAYTSPSDTPFDASQMEDMAGDESESQSSRVSCTVGIGLRCRKRNESGGEVWSREDWDVAMKSRIVLAAKLFGQSNYKQVQDPLDPGPKNVPTSYDRPPLELTMYNNPYSDSLPLLSKSAPSSPLPPDPVAGQSYQPLYLGRIRRKERTKLRIPDLGPKNVPTSYDRPSTELLSLSTRLHNPYSPPSAMYTKRSSNPIPGGGLSPLSKSAPSSPLPPSLVAGQYRPLYL